MNDALNRVFPLCINKCVRDGLFAFLRTKTVQITRFTDMHTEDGSRPSLQSNTPGFMYVSNQMRVYKYLNKQLNKLQLKEKCVKYNSFK